MSLESDGGMILTVENRRTRRKTCPSATLSTTNPTWIDPGLHCERPATNDLSRGTARAERLHGDLVIWVGAGSQSGASTTYCVKCWFVEVLWHDFHSANTIPYSFSALCFVINLQPLAGRLFFKNASSTSMKVWTNTRLASTRINVGTQTSLLVSSVRSTSGMFVMTVPSILRFVNTIHKYCKTVLFKVKYPGKAWSY
jgi:hypothetical protein